MDYFSEYDPFPGENFAVLISVVGGSIVMGIIAFCCRMLRRRRQQHYLEEDMDDFANGPYVKKYGENLRFVYKYNSIHEVDLICFDVKFEAIFQLKSDMSVVLDP